MLLQFLDLPGEKLVLLGWESNALFVLYFLIEEIITQLVVLHSKLFYPIQQAFFFLLGLLLGLLGRFLLFKELFLQVFFFLAELQVLLVLAVQGLSELLDFLLESLLFTCGLQLSLFKLRLKLILQLLLFLLVLWNDFFLSLNRLILQIDVSFPVLSQILKFILQISDILFEYFDFLVLEVFLLL